jgi:oxygen-dependent protoporphyrinogen oxidase
VNNGSTIVVGAGLSGLACAFDLARAGREVGVLEAGERAGGVVGTLERDGFRFETGPNTIQASAAAFRTLCGDLGLADRLIVSPPEQADRYVFVRGRIRALPATPLEFLATPVLSLASRLCVCSEAFRPWKPPADGVEPDLASFITERLGAEAARVLGGAFVRGVYAAEMAELGARSAMPRMWRAVVEHKSLVRAMRALGKRPELDLPGPRVPRTALLSFPDGLQELVRGLERALEKHGAQLLTGSAASGLERLRSAAGGRRWRVATRNGRSLEADDVVLAVPAPIAVKLAERALPPEISLETLRRIVHSRVTLVHLGFDRRELPEMPAGFGFLVPPPDPARRAGPGVRSSSGVEPRTSSGASPSAGSGANNAAPAGRPGSEDPLVLGTIFASNLFPGRAPRDGIAVTCFYKSGDVEGMNEQALSARAGRDLALALGRAEPPRPRVVLTQRWTDVIPHYAPGHADRMRDLLRELESRAPGLQLAGSYVAGVSVDDVIARGRAAAAAITRAAAGAAREPDPAPGALR